VLRATMNFLGMGISFLPDEAREALERLADYPEKTETGFF
jgi:hypothetical protein